MTSPISILVIAIIVVIVLLTKVIPVFQNMFREFKSGALPAPTQFVISISEGFKHYWYVFFGSATGLFFGGSFILSTNKGRDAFDAFILKVPVIGSTIRKIIV